MVISWKPSVQKGHRLLGEEFCTDENFLERVSYGEGDGTKVSAWNDHWIPRTGSLRPLGWDPDGDLDKVSKLLLTNGQGWDENKLR
jgi:hypothetical protein